MLKMHLKVVLSHRHHALKLQYVSSVYLTCRVTALAGPRVVAVTEINLTPQYCKRKFAGNLGIELLYHHCYLSMATIVCEKQMPKCQHSN